MGRTKKLKNPKATTVQLTDDERTIIDTIRKQRKMTQSEVIRLAIQEMGKSL